MALLWTNKDREVLLVCTTGCSDVLRLGQADHGKHNSDELI